jgi:hypothetical protein
LQRVEIAAKTAEDIETASDFQTWWKLYPGSDGFAHHPPTRGLKIDESACKRLFKEIIENKEATGKELIEALQKEINALKSASINENRFTYMKNSYNYLNTKAYAGWLNYDPSEQESNFNDYGKGLD